MGTPCDVRSSRSLLDLANLADGGNAATDPAGIYSVLTEYPSSAVPEGSVYRINTGAPLPLGTDSVIMVEDTMVYSRHEGENGEEKEVELLAQVDQGENVRREGSDVRQGEKVLEEGDVVSAVGGEIGTLAFVGRKGVRPSELCTRRRADRLSRRQKSTADLSSQSSRPATSSSPSPTRAPSLPPPSP